MKRKLKGPRDLFLLFCFVGFGFSSGIPFLASFSTLTARLVDYGHSKTAVGLLVLATLPYAFKFLFSPWVEAFSLPPLTRWLGRRRSCALFMQVIIIVLLFMLGAAQPRTEFWYTVFLALAVSLAASVQDLALEAYRIEMTRPQNRGLSAWSISFGFRLGYLSSGAGALFLASFMPWSFVYEILGSLMFVGILAVVLAPKSRTEGKKPLFSFRSNRENSFWGVLWRKGVLKLRRYPSFGWLIFLLILVKLTDAVLHTLNVPFLMEIGYTKLLIAEYVKFMGTATMLFGGFISGLWLQYFSLWSLFLLTSVMQIAAAFCFFLKAWELTAGGVPLTLLVCLENLASGLTTTLFIAYMSALVRAPYTAIQYGILASIGSFSRVLWSSLSGFFADALGWAPFFFGLTLASLPLLILVLRGKRLLNRL